ncbi:MAG: hypothetical protein ACRCWI_05385 [Brevinema sp.]
MKIILFLFFCLSNVSLWSIDLQTLQGNWYRTYGVYRPWTDSNQGTFSYYEEDLIFHPNNIVYIYDKNSEKFRGKSVFTILTRVGLDFIVFHTPEQDPTEDLIQQKQGFFIKIVPLENNEESLQMITVRDYNKARNKDSLKGINYRRVKEVNQDLNFIIPQNDI